MYLKILRILWCLVTTGKRIRCAANYRKIEGIQHRRKT